MTLVYQNATEEQILFLREQNFKFVETKTEYEAQRLQKKGMFAVWYTSGKLVIQGSENELEKLSTILKHKNMVPKETKQKIREEKNYGFDSIKHIGSDETLKGDTFGGLVVCAFNYEPEIKEELLLLGIKDSKQLSENKIIEMAKLILEKYSKRISIFELKPQEYNQRTKVDSITKILNKAHKELAKKLDPNSKHIVDKYPGCNVGDISITKGEENSLAIATASIVARYLALEQFSKLSKQAGFKLPKGSTHVRNALELLVKKGEQLSLFAKLHFKNVKLILDNSK